MFQRYSARAVRAALAVGLEDLPPVYFALVMATGVVSVAADICGMRATR